MEIIMLLLPEDKIPKTTELLRNRYGADKDLPALIIKALYEVVGRQAVSEAASVTNTKAGHITEYVTRATSGG